MAGSDNIVNFGIKVDRDLIESNINKVVAASIADALGNKEALVQNAIETILTSYVDKTDGKTKKRKGDYNAVPWLTYAAEQIVREAVSEEMKKAVEANREAFQEAIKKEMSKPKVRGQIAANFIKAMLDASNKVWRMPVTVNFEPVKEEY